MIAGTPKPIAPVGRLPFAFAKRHGVLVRGVADGRAQVVYREGAKPSAVAELRRFLGIPLVIERVGESAFDELLRKAYEGGSGEAGQIVEGIEGETDLAGLAEGLPEPSDLMESEDDAPVIRLINAVLSQAIKENASDIHIEPFENRLVIRFRVDGVLREVLQTKRAVAPLLVSRIKVMSQSRHRREAPAAGRPHQPAHRRPRRGRARLDHAVGPRRARGAAPARQAGGPARPLRARHGAARRRG